MAHALTARNQLTLAARSPATGATGLRPRHSIGCAVLGALLPDLDASESKIKHLKLPGMQFKPFLLPAQIVHRSDQHRGLFYSLWGLGMAGACTLPLAFWIGWVPVAALLLGYASHLLGDSATKSGLRLRYPNARRYHLLPFAWRITTGSQVFGLRAALLLLPALLLFFQQM